MTYLLEHLPNEETLKKKRGARGLFAMGQKY